MIVTGTWKNLCQFPNHPLSGYLEFHPDERLAARWWRYQQVLMRDSVLAWLDEIFLDIAYDENLPEYRELRDYLEFTDGTSSLPGVRFYFLPQDMANKNIAHDQPGFRDDCANQTM